MHLFLFLSFLNERRKAIIGYKLYHILLRLYHALVLSRSLSLLRIFALLPQLYWPLSLLIALAKISFYLRLILLLLFGAFVRSRFGHFLSYRMILICIYSHEEMRYYDLSLSPLLLVLLFFREAVGGNTTQHQRCVFLKLAVTG